MVTCLVKSSVLFFTGKISLLMVCDSDRFKISRIPPIPSRLPLSHSTLQIPSLCADPFKTSAPIPYCSLFHRLKRSPQLIRPFRQLSSDSLQAFSRLSRRKIDLGRRAQHRAVSATQRGCTKRDHGHLGSGP
ncbi:hypothetical protein CDAR_413461 [Caerostris darwini]|uniref:Uncharacterized protein n=1 Tax=Caerostris darwini TaxID=1538125 RepID=A0AAV4S8V2_9ARAC|nr:hypothetical protein CDAR_413461 [Caerostris darwini]